MKQFVAQFIPALRVTLVLLAVTCGVYPLFVTGIATFAFKRQASGSLIKDEVGTTRGSALISQPFVSDRYFHPRPSAAGAGHDAAASGGFNLGPTSRKLHETVRERIAAYRALNGLSDTAVVPADAVTASASGLDPHISLSNAELQAPRVANARSLPEERIREVVAACVEPRDFGLFGEPRVNVLTLNLRLDASERIPRP